MQGKESDEPDEVISHAHLECVTYAMAWLADDNREQDTPEIKRGWLVAEIETQSQLHGILVAQAKDFNVNHKESEGQLKKTFCDCAQKITRCVFGGTKASLETQIPGVHGERRESMGLSAVGNA